VTVKVAILLERFAAAIVIMSITQILPCDCKVLFAILPYQEYLQHLLLTYVLLCLHRGVAAGAVAGSYWGPLAGEKQNITSSYETKVVLSMMSASMA
jgi:hypothetical protein